MSKQIKGTIRSRKSYGRNPGKRGEFRRRFLIVCEGEKTEYYYFKGFRNVTSNVIHVTGLGKNPYKIVKVVLQLRKQALKEGKPYDKAWCVFDKDEVPNEDFNRALSTAAKEDVMVAYSNEAFELWFLLHFNLVNTGISRTQYSEKLSRLLHIPYEKNLENMYEILTEKRLKTAILNAGQLLAKYKNPDPAKDNPSTTVHLLVKDLLMK